MDPVIKDLVYKLCLIKLLIDSKDNLEINKGCAMFSSIKKELNRQTDQGAVAHLESSLDKDLTAAKKQIEDIIELIFLVKIKKHLI